MKEYIGKRVKIFIKSGKNSLVYTGLVMKVTDEHIYFEDKYNELICHKIKNIEEISSI